MTFIKVFADKVKDFKKHEDDVNDFLDNFGGNDAIMSAVDGGWLVTRITCREKKVWEKPVVVGEPNVISSTEG